MQLVGMMYDKNPLLEEEATRPVICKDPNEIAMQRNMTWCPDPPNYAPIRNLREDDKETLRLACYHPTQSSALTFKDASPNYHIDQDVWALTHASRAAPT